MYKTLLAGTLALMLSSCASMNKSECMITDWQMVGHEDGARGYGTERLARYRKACAKHAVVPDLAAYQKGRSHGLLEYCKPSRGFALGKSGASYGGVCPSELERDFLDAYNSGRRLHQLRASVADAEKQIRHRKSELEQVDEHLADVQAALISETTTTRERVALLVEIKDLLARHGALEAELEDLIALRDHREDELYSYTAELNGD